MVHHVYQSVYEHYEFSFLHGWRFIDRGTADDWPSGTYDFVELRHNGDTNNGLYGSHIIG